MVEKDTYVPPVNPDWSDWRDKVKENPDWFKNPTSTKGYITIAQNSEDNDYLEMSYALALSLKATQKINKLCVCVDEETKKLITDRHREVFDAIVDIPWNDDAKGDKWKIHNKWKYSHMTPYHETIILDSDMIFTDSVDHWWDYLSTKNLWFCTNVKTFRNEDVTSDYYRKKFTLLNLPNIYSNFTYFKKSQETFMFFKMVELIMTHWNAYFDKFLSGMGQNWMSADIAYALAIQLLDIEEETCDYDIKDVPTFVHMKSMVQNIPESEINSIWTKSITSEMGDDLQVKIGNFTQTLPVHYVEKNWMDSTKIKQLEDAVL
jgi:hypothetical protein